MVRGSWFVVRGSWFVVCGLWLVVRGSWFVVCGLWFVLLNFLTAVEVVGGERVGFEQPLEIALVHHAAALAPGAGAEIHDVVGRAHHLRVVLHHHHGVAAVAQLLQRGDQARVVAGV